ncbi:hypothetical protein BLX06_23465 [Bacillus cereus]|uniref:Uncharacterized protein n=1 Tax=Bacillus cereus TaxID=1396 RepID=A0A9X6GDQ1_BACCE|nr:hypothetical protein BLX06_23465 [Bacillus cereus]
MKRFGSYTGEVQREIRFTLRDFIVQLSKNIRTIFRHFKLQGILVYIYHFDFQWNVTLNKSLI